MVDSSCGTLDDDSLEIEDARSNSGTQKLYERLNHQRDLIDAYQRCIQSSSSKELVMINGASGTGKTALANAFRAHVENHDNGIWIHGKFEQIHRAKPYGTFLSALTELVKAVEARGPEKIQETQQAVTSSMDLDDQLWLASAVPHLAKLLSTAEPTSTTFNTAILSCGVVARNRFQRIMPMIIKAICSSLDTSLVLFLDDLQWSDSACLNLLRDITNDNESSPFMVLGACRGDEVGIDHPLAVTLRHLEDKDNVKVTHILVSNLRASGVEEFVSDALDLPAIVIQPLAQIVFRETEGNIFYMIRFLQTLRDSGFLYQDAIRQQWTWDEEKIRPRYDDVLGLLSAAMRKFPDHVQQVLQIAACLGTMFKEPHLQTIVSFEVEPALALTEAENIIIANGDNGDYVWVHDRWQQAAYNLISETERSRLHLQIGRMLWNGSSPEQEGHENLFLIVNQILKGAHLITDDDERQIASMLCLQAGEMAAKSSAFEAAAVFMDQGLGLLNRRHWRDQYELSLRLYNNAAEMEYCNGRFNKVISLTDEVFQNARCPEDRLQAYTTRVYAVGSQGNHGQALDIGLPVLKQLGVSFPRKARIHHVAIEFFKTKQVLRRKSDDDILNLPPLADRNKAAAINLMNLLTLFAKMECWNLCAIMAFRMVRLTVQEGLAGASCAPCFSFYGSFLCWLNDVDEGFRFAQISLMILKKYNAKEWIPRVSATVFGVILPWKANLRDCLPGLYDAYRIGCESGDFEIAMVSSSLYSLAQLLCGHPLSLIRPQIMTCYDQLKKMGQEKKARFTELKIEYLGCLMEGGEMPRTKIGSLAKDEIVFDSGTPNRENLFTTQLAFWRLVVSFFLGDYVLADDIVKSFGRPRKMGPPFIYAAFHTLSSVVSLTLAHNSGRNIREVRRNLRTLQKWMPHCPENFGNKVLLIEAELERSGGKHDEALSKYNESIRLAENQNNLMEQALACERAGTYLRDSGSPSAAMSYFEQARKVYQEWGSKFKVEHMKSLVEMERLKLTHSS